MADLFFPDYMRGSYAQTPHREQILQTLRSLGTQGATDEQLQIFLQINPSTERPRRQELQHEGFVRDSGRIRRVKSGRFATVWVANF